MSVLNFHPALAHVSRSLGPGERDYLEARRLAWGCASVPHARLAPHFILLGGSGSGKTLSTKILMHSLLPDSEYALTYRASLFDPKRELYPFLVRCGIPESLIVLTHPYDARCVAWHLAADFRDDGHAHALAGAFIPRRPETSDTQSKDFWTNASNQILVEVVKSVMLASPSDWTLRDIIEVCGDRDVLREMLSRTASGRDTWVIYFEESDRLAKDILATLHSYLFPYHAIAALWHRCEHRFSLTAWRAGTGVLVLGADPERQEIMRTLNNLLIQRMSQILLAHLDEEPPDQTWLVFDELREAGKFPGFQSLLTMGRSKGVRLVLAFQDIAGLDAAFGRNEAREIVGLCDNKAFLRLGSPETARYAADVFAETEREVISRAVSADQKHSKTYTPQRVFEVLPIEFLELPLASTAGGAIEGYFHHPGGLCYRGRLESHEVDALMPPRRDALPAAFIPRPLEHQRRIEWTREDYDRFGLRPPSQKKKMTNRRARADGDAIRVMPWHKRKDSSNDSSDP